MSNVLSPKESLQQKWKNYQQSHRNAIVALVPLRDSLPECPVPLRKALHDLVQGVVALRQVAESYYVRCSEAGALAQSFNGHLGSVERTYLRVQETYVNLFQATSSSSAVPASETTAYTNFIDALGHLSRAREQFRSQLIEYRSELYLDVLPPVAAQPSRATATSGVLLVVDARKEEHIPVPDGRY